MSKVRYYVDVNRHSSVGVGKLNIPWPEDEVDIGDSEWITPWFRWCKRRKLDKIAIDFQSENC